jgi:glutathione S-transferase
MTEAPAPYSLLTFAPMVDSELCRFLLLHYAISYRERPHTFGWVSLLALGRCGTLQVPALYGSGLRLAGPRQIVEHFDQSCPTEQMLLPSRQPLQIQVERDWELYNGQLAAHSAVLAYFHLLPHRDIMIEPFFRGVPETEASVFRSAYPFLRGLLTILLQLREPKAKDVLVRIRMIFDATDMRVRDGRPYLVGDRLTLGDLSLAAAAAPLLVPRGYGSPIPPIGRMPNDYAKIVEELRQHPTSEFVQRIYDRHYFPQAGARRASAPSACATH